MFTIGGKERVESLSEKDFRFREWFRNLKCKEKLLVPIGEIKEVWLRYDAAVS